jgi:hypothetical protein
VYFINASKTIQTSNLQYFAFAVYFWSVLEVKPEADDCGRVPKLWPTGRPGPATINTLGISSRPLARAGQGRFYRVKISIAF